MHAVSNGVNHAPPAAVKRAIKPSKDQKTDNNLAKKTAEKVKHTFDKKGDWSLMTATR